MSGVARIEACRRRVAVPLLVAILLLAGCSGPAPKRGFNLLQHRAVAFTEAATQESLRALQATGADSVVLVPFLEQESAGADAPRRSRHVTDAQLVAAMRQARRLGLTVVVKPQLLVDAAWAGAVDPPTPATWFAAYQEQLLHYAVLAQRERASAFVIGTELARLEAADEWGALITTVRQVFHGRLTYAAHNVEGVRRFRFWDRLDAVGLTLYPDLGESAETTMVRARIEAVLDALELARPSRVQPVWLLEVGHPSATGSLPRPWDWRRLTGDDVHPDVATQATVLVEWVAAASSRPWIEALLVWCWYSDPNAGGPADRDYTVQNKPAEAAIRCQWRGECRGQLE